MDNFDDDVQKEDHAANEDSNYIRKIDINFRKTFENLRNDLDRANEKCIEAVANEVDEGNDDYAPLGAGQVGKFLKSHLKQFSETEWP